MHIVFFNHPAFLGSQSMPRFATLLADGMKSRGHRVENWAPKAFFYKIPLPGTFKKWLGYMDQYLVFPFQVKIRMVKCAEDTLFVFTDHALGPWVPLVKDKPHVIHCHDFLAQRSALAQIPENIVHSTGKIYQRFIRRGYARGKNFISVSEKTRADLHHFLGFSPDFSKVVYNGLTQEFKPFNGDMCTTLPSIAHDIDAGKGYILHVGGNQWYKNRVGVIEIYNAWRKKFDINLPLVLLGAPPDRKILNEYCESPVKKDIYLLSGKCDAYLRSAYAQASVFLFPSIAEGFGWPIAEAMASGCPVITTGIAPMTEVAGDAAFLIDKRPLELSDVPQWADMCANTVNKVVTLPPADRKGLIKKGIKNSERFKTAAMLAEIERLYADAIMAAEG